MLNTACGFHNILIDDCTFSEVSLGLDVTAISRHNCYYLRFAVQSVAGACEVAERYKQRKYQPLCELNNVA